VGRHQQQRRAEQDQHADREHPLDVALLQERVGAMLVERLQQEPDSEVRGRIFRFPAELSSLKERLHEVLTELCAGSRLVEAPLLRGVYFASGTQAQEAVKAAPQGQVPRMRRSYFLARLFKDVVFDEASIVARDRRLSRRQMILRRTALGTACALVAIVLAGWIATYFQNANAIARAEASIDSYEQQLRGIPVRDVSDADFLRILPALDDLRNVTAGFSQNRFWSVSFGVDQERKIASRQRVAYQRALNALLLPRMLVQLQAMMEETEDLSEAFDALKLYGMLGGLGPVDSDFVELGAERMFGALYPGEGRAAARRALVEHARALTSGPIESVELDDTVINQARAVIANQSMPGRAFDILQNMRQARALSPWIPADALGPLGEQAFERTSQASLREGIPGLFTRTGYYTVVLPQITQAARIALDEQWVRGGTPIASGITVESVAQATLQLYFDNFEQRWSSLLSDLRTKPSQGFVDAAETMRVLAADQAPLDLVSRSIAEATDLRATAGILGQQMPSTTLSSAQAPDPYSALRAALEETESRNGFNGEDEPGSQIAALQPVLSTLYGQLSRAATSTAEVAQLFDSGSQLTEANQALLEQARRLPEPLNIWTAGIAADIGSLAVKTARTRLGQHWAADGARLCSSIVVGRYPFDRSSARDVAMADFVRLFGPSGIFSIFFRDRLEPFVDTTASPWRWRGTFGAEGIPSEAIAQFENADRIRRAFFPGGSESPRVTINITPVSMSENTNTAMLEIEGERVVYGYGRSLSKSISWPSDDTSNTSRLAFLPGGLQEALTQDGDWSPFRLFDQAQITQEGEDLFRARFQHAGQWAEFDVQFGSVLNPFRMPAIEEFECPTQF
jgi:type VI secretion system protein ImpL